MQLTDIAGSRFELVLVDYQFPCLTHDRHDANWLEVTVTVKLGELAYTATDACMTTTNAGSLALWLRNIADDVQQSPRMDFLEPVLSFDHWGVDGDIVTLHIDLADKLRPPGSSWRETLRMELTLPREQLIAASDALHDDLTRFPPRAGAEMMPPFVPPVLLPTFVIDWDLSVPARTESDALRAIEQFVAWVHLDASIRGIDASDPGRYRVRFVTALPVGNRDFGGALLHLLRHLPHPYGSPRVGPLMARPEGLFECQGQIDPTRHDEPIELEEGEQPDEEYVDFGEIKGWFALTNYERPDRFRYCLFP